MSIPLAENEILIRHGVVSIFPFLFWAGRVEIIFDGQEYNRYFPTRFLKKKASADAKAFAEHIKSEMGKEGFNEVLNARF